MGIFIIDRANLRIEEILIFRESSVSILFSNFNNLSDEYLERQQQKVVSMYF